MHLCCFRLHPKAEDVHMAIGPWHARVHKAICQRQFGARQTPESGLTFGDNIEHLWAPLRKQSHLLKYMSKARRQDHLTTLVSHVARYNQVLGVSVMANATSLESAQQ